MDPVTGMITITGAYEGGEVFLDEKGCPFKAQLGSSDRGMTTILMAVAVPSSAAESVLAGLKRANLMLDTVPPLVAQ